MIMSKTGGAAARRSDRAGARALAACLTAAVAWAVALVAAPSSAEAAYAKDTWVGYNEFGYVAKGRPERRASAFSSGIRKQIHRAERRSRKSADRNGAEKGSADKGVRYAALHPMPSKTDATPEAAPKPDLGAGGGIRWTASSGCLNSTLRSVVAQVAASYGPVTVNSTCRSRRHNARVGGARRSQHLTGDAVDFRVNGNVRGAIAYLRGAGRVGGFKHYGGGLFHVDTGPRRTW
jgi:hypothetical protein